MTLNSEPTRGASQKDEFSAPSKDETKALRRLYRKGPITIEVENTIDDCIQSGAVWRRHKRRNQKRLWENLAWIMREGWRM
jgi:hypothetical protein